MPEVLETLAGRKHSRMEGAKTMVAYPQDQELRRVAEPLQNPHQIECEMDILSEFSRGSKTG
jgi:hypothetical protein